MKGDLASVTTRLLALAGEQDRAVLAQVQLGAFAGGADTAEAMAAQLRESLGADAEVLVVRDDPAVRQRLYALNTGRDQLLRRVPAVVLVCATGEHARLLRKLAPDLTAVFDLVAEVQPRVDLSFDALRDALRAAQAERFQQLDLSGLVPHTGDFVDLPLEALYQRRFVGTRQGEADLAGGEALLLAGEPGAGKSTWLRRLAATGRGPDRAVLFVPLSLWAAQARERQIPLLDFVEGQAGALLEKPGLELGPHLPRMVLLLDGLDEVPTVVDRRYLVDQALALRQAHRGLVVVLAGRDHVVDDLLAEQRRRVRVVELRRLDAGQGRTLVQALLRARRGLSPDQPLPEDAQRLWRQVVGSEDFRRFGGNPLLLSFLAVVADMGRGLPSQRVELYNDLVEMLIVSWQRVRSGQAGRRLNRADVLRVVAPLAWRLVERGVGGLTEAELLDFLAGLEQREPDVDRAREAARQRLDRLREDSALLCAADGLWRFHHASIAEFLAARAALQAPALREALAADPYEPRRAQVLAFTLALSCDLEPRDDVALPLLHALDDKARRRGRYDAKIPRILALCLEEARSMPGALRQRLAGHALRVAFVQKLAAGQRVEALFAAFRLLRVEDEAVAGALRALQPALSSVDWARLAPAWLFASGRSSWWFGDLPADLLRGLSLGVEEQVALIERWARSPDVAVRALAWQAWTAGSTERRVLARSADPEAVALYAPVEGQSPPPPAGWTEALRAAFPDLPG